MHLTSVWANLRHPDTSQVWLRIFAEELSSICSNPVFGSDGGVAELIQNHVIL